MAVSNKAYYPALTGLRAIAAYLVFFHHANPFSKTGWQFFFHPIIHEFHVGVSIFFVLSGFLIYSRYQHTAATNKKWIGEYLRNRFARIFPLYFVLTTIVFVASYFFKKSEEASLSIYLLNITFLKGFFNELKFTGIAQGWSLTTEECFYFSVPFIFWWSQKRKSVLQPFVFISAGIVLVLVFRNIDFYGFFASFKFMFIYTFFGRCFEFFVGVWIAMYIGRLTRKHTISLTASGIVLCLLLTYALSWFNTNGESGLYQWPGTFINNFLFPLAVGMLLVGLIRESTKVSRLLSTPLFQMLGKSSYAFYLIHAGVFYAAVSYITTNIFFIFILFNIAAIGLYLAMEKPLQERLRAT